MASPDALALDAFAHVLKRADLQVSHDRVNCITIGNPTDLQLLTQRSEEEDNATRAASKAFHTAFHEHSTLGYSMMSQNHYPKNESTPITHFHASSAILSNSKTPWREVEESIEHIYEDPSTDFVQLKLLHRSSETSKRQKLLERERVLAAASELREREQREREQFDALQRKKMHVEQLSEAIRLRNKKHFLKSEPNYELIDKPAGVAAAKRPDDQLGGPKRKPPVPRQRGRRKEQSQTRNDRLKKMTEAITLQMVRRSASPRTAAPEVGRRAKKEKPTNQDPWSVSSSILLGDLSEFAPKDNVRQSIGEESHEGHEVGGLNPSSGSSQEVAAESISTPERNIEEEEHAHPPKRPRSNRKPNRPVRSEEPEPNPVEIKEKTERRELAREYMELQKQSRKLRNVKEKQRRELETQRRRLQLEKLEQERVESLRRSKKLSFKRSRNAFGSEKDHHSPQREFPRRRVAQEKKFGVPMSEDGDADDTKVRGLFADDEGHHFIASDQENQRNNRNQMHDRATDLHDFGGQRSGYDASVLIGYSSADDKHSPMASCAQSAPTEVDVRLRRLLELEQKTRRLSMLVSGMKIHKGAPPSTASAHVQMREEEEEPSDNEDDLQISIVKGGADLHDDREDLFENAAERSGKHEEEAASDDHEHDEERSEDEESVLKRYAEAEEALSDDSGDDQYAVDGETSGREDEDENEEHRIVNTRFHMNAYNEEVQLPTSASIAVDSATAQMSCVDTPEFDLRSIGVHSIKVEWPMEHDSSDGGGADSDGGEVSPRRSFSASSSASSRPELQYDQAQVLLSSSHRSLGSDRSSRSTDQFEASIHAYMEQRHLRDQTPLSSEDAAERNASSHSSLHDQRDEIAPMHAVLTPPMSKTTEPNEALLRMIREADDSLSVINSIAKKIWLQQQQKSRAQAEKQRQQELEALKLEQELKDQQLKAVMDSLTAKHTSNSDSEDESDGYVEKAREVDPSSVESVLPFNRLEDIIREIEDERLREQQAALSATIVTGTPDSETHQDGLQHDKPPTSIFWNDMLASSESLARNNNNVGKFKTVIDRSELMLQQTQQQHQAEDALFSQSYHDGLKRVHSPKALARLLLAEVAYHEAIHDAHLQLSMMEQAQIVEQAQEETMNVANAFKEEMEKNLTSHQLSLDHAILFKQFDGDLQDAMQELEAIQQTQASELAATTAGMQNELKRASLRESTVQTDELKCMDAATNAKLYAESGTSTSPHFSDAAVQYETPEKEQVMMHQNPAVNQLQTAQSGGASAKSMDEEASADDEAYSEEEEYDEDHFERESQSIVIQDSVKRSEKSTSEMMSSGSANEIPDEEEQESDAENVLDEDDELTEKPKQSTASSTNPYKGDEIHSENYGEEDEERDGQSDGYGSVASSAIDETSAISDGKYASEKDDPTPQVVSASMGYEGDFDVSTTSQVHAVKKSTSNDSDIAEDEGEEEEDDEASSASVVSADDIEDEVPGESNFKESDKVASGGSAYPSEFSGSTKEEPKSKPAPIVPVANILERAMPIEVRMRRDATSRQVEPDMFPVDLWNGGSHTDDLTRVYERDLEMCKRSDESLLLVRLQVLERKFYRDLQSIDEAIADANEVSSKQQELLLRKEATKMAFLSEKANVESLRAASMARYYQDLLAFQSLMAGADPSLTVAVPSQISQCVYAFPVTQVPTRQALMTEHDENEASDVQDEYSDEFNSVSGKAEFEPDGGEASDSDVKSQRSISSIGNDEKASEIGEADDVSANERVKSAHDDEEEDDAYDEEFASVSNSDAQSAAQKFEGENDDNVEDDGSIDDGFEKYSAKSETPSAVVSVAEDETDEHSITSKEKEKEAERQESEGDYEDEFASISESGGPSKPSKQVDGDEEDDVIGGASQEDGKHKGVSDDDDDDDDDASQIHSENFEDDFEDDSEGDDGDGDVHEAASIQDEQENVGAKVENNLLYSNDFETDVPRHEHDEENESQSVSKQLDVAGTTIVVDQSGSEDSSTTRLLIEQVSQLQQLIGRHNELEVKHAEEKLARKKIKTIELVQAKERLIKLEKDKFKLEEEERQVDTLAQLAIQMDVHGELSKAKDHIKQQLEHEMATVQQTFPGFARVPPDSGATNAEVLVTTRPVFETVQSLPPKGTSTPKPLVIAGKSTTKSQEVAQSIRAEVEPNGEYEVDSFENDNGYEDGAYEEDAYQSSFAEKESQFVEDSRATKTADIVDAEGEIASEADEFASVSGDGAEGSGVPSEPPVDDEAASPNDFDGEKPGDDGAAVASDDGEESIDDYADEYEDESFDDDDAKSATFMKTHEEEVDDEEQNPRDENRMKATTTGDDEAASNEYNDDEYSEEEFERASGASEVDLKPSPGAVDDGVFENADKAQDPPTLNWQSDQLDNVQEDQHGEVSIDQLSTALEIVISQLHQSVAEARASATSADSADHEAHDLSVAPQVGLHEDSCVLPAQLSVSISHEEEVLSKSIAEQTKRLEELKQMILARKDEILSVQKNMRVEKRREQLTGEEKRLWDEMERAEANLRMDEAALELTRQRNRLEAMHLEAKHFDYKAKTLNLDRADLLEGFDFVEIAEIPDLKAKQSVNPGEAAAQSKKKTVWGATSDMVCQTDSVVVASLAEGLDLLAGYVYVEDAERVPVIPESILPAVSCIAACEANELDEADNSNPCAPLVDEGALIADNFQEIGGDECPGSNDEASLLDQDTLLAHDASVQLDSDAMELLSGYSYVEAVEPTACVQEDLLAAFDYVEEVDPVGAHKPGDSNSELASTEELVVDQNEQSDDDFAGEEIASEIDGDECVPSPSFDAGDDEGITGRGGDSPVSKQAAEGTAQQQTIAGDAAEILRYDSDEHQDDVTGAGADHPFHSSAHRDGVGFVDHLTDTIYEALFDDVMKDAQEMCGRISVTSNEAQLGGGSVRESEVEGIIRDSEESVDSISTEPDAADRTETEPPSEAKLTKQSSSTIVQEALVESGDAVRNVRVDQLTDALFKELCDQVLSAGVVETLKKKKQRQSNAHSANATTREEVDNASDAENAALVAASVTTSRAELTKRANREAAVSSPFAEREFVSSIVQRLEISANGVVIPAYSEAKQLTTLGSSRVLYEVVKDTANSILAKHTASSHYDGVTSDGKVDTSAIKQEVEVELERILPIRAAGSDELKRQTQSLSAEMDSDQVTQEDLQVMQTQFRTSVSQVADYMCCNLIVGATSGSIATTTTGNCTPRSHFYHPRTLTSTSRPSSSSSSRRPVMLVHSLLRYESAQLQERITNFILDDLLNENTSSSEHEE